MVFWKTICRKSKGNISEYTQFSLFSKATSSKDQGLATKVCGVLSTYSEF